MAGPDENGVEGAMLVLCQASAGMPVTAPVFFGVCLLGLFFFVQAYGK